MNIGGVDVLLVDTAGRLAIDEALMAEIKELHAILKPVETLFIVDAMQGQDAVNTAKAFKEALPLTGIILTGQIDMNKAEKDIKRKEGIIQSMTPLERRKPELIKATRKRRIAAGSGVQVQEVNRLLNEFEQMQGMMKKMKGSGMMKMMKHMAA